MTPLRELVAAVREDAHFAYRSLLRAPSYAGTIIVTLALAIGGLTAVFSVLYAVMLRPLPFREPQEIVAVMSQFTKLNPFVMGLSPSEFRDVHDKSTAFSQVAVYNTGSINLTGHGEAMRASAGWVSPEFFRLFGVPPVLGRDFTLEDDRLDAPRVAILSSAFHKKTFGGTPDVVGQIIDLDGAPYTIIGVLPPVYDREPRVGDDPEESQPRDVWMPIRFRPEQFQSRGSRFLATIARLKPGATIQSARDDLNRLADSFVPLFPSDYRPKAGWAFTVDSLKAYSAGTAATTLTLLLAAVGLLLLAACANVVSITLARLAARKREIAVRVALGATPARIALQFLVESIMVALAGGMLGILVGRVGMDALLTITTDTMVTKRVGVAFQWPVLVFALAVSVLTGLLAGAAPAVQAARLSPTVGLAEGGRSTNARALRLRSALVVAQVAVALALLVGTGMMLRSVVTLTTVSPGFDPTDVYTGRVLLAMPRYAESADQRRYVMSALERLRATPGVESVGFTSILPFSGFSKWGVFIEDDITPEILPSAQLRFVGGDFFQTMRLPLVAGRLFTAADANGAPDVAIVNRAFVAEYFAGHDPVGRTIQYRQEKGKRRAFTIVGIVENSLEMGIDAPAETFVYLPFDQWPFGGNGSDGGFLVRAPKLGSNALSAMQSAVTAVDPTQPFYAALPLQYLVDESLGSRRFTLVLLAVFAGLGLALAALGIYGTTSYSVVQRTQEIAVRMAMGADEVAILRLILGQALRLVVIGLGVGGLLATILSKYVASLMYGLSAWDPQAVVVIALLLVTVALVAGLVPARRAAALPLANALRTE